MLHSITDGMKRIDVSANHAKNNLAVGTVLQVQGYRYTKYVIVKNLGINEKYPSYGTRYLVIDLDDYTQSRQAAYELEYIADKKDDRIQVYITTTIKNADDVLDIWEKSENLRKERETRQQQATEQRELNITQGKELFKKYIPEDAKALIIACHDINDSDIQTDYFNHKTDKQIILGWSKHTRDLFSEMRKHATKLEETKHLGINEPEFEHREKYSMGAGYYLKDGYNNSTGWRVYKLTKYSTNWNEDLYISISKTCIFEK